VGVCARVSTTHLKQKGEDYRCERGNEEMLSYRTFKRERRERKRGREDDVTQKERGGKRQVEDCDVVVFVFILRSLLSSLVQLSHAKRREMHVP
jgi:hypothetical protein